MAIFAALLLCSVLSVIFAANYCPPGFCDPPKTCCPSVSGVYACCDLAHAVCCEDGVHCCPPDTVCDIASKSCVQDRAEAFPFDFTKREGEIVLENVDENEANLNRCDKRSYCPDSATCCEKPNGQYNCCPFHNGNCCPDKLHCCPQGEQCDSNSFFCIREDKIVGLTHFKEIAIPFV